MKRKLSDPGTVTMITGVMGSGKTDLALRFAETIIEKHPETVIITNIVMNRSVRKWKILYCNSWWNFLKLIVEHEKSILILDEAGIFASTTDSGKMSDMANWNRFIKLSRKFGMSIFWIDQRDYGSIPPTVRELAVFHVHKPEKYSYELWAGFRGDRGSNKIKQRFLTSKDRTNIPFDTLSTGSWLNDMPKWYEGEDSRQLTIRDLFDKVSSVNGSEIRRTMKEWITEIKRNNEVYNDAVQERDKKKVLQESSSHVTTLKEIVFFILDADLKKGRKRGPSEIGKFLDRKPQSISRIMKEWKEQNTEII